MRKVFSSQRLENVEAVADMLRGEGIAVKIENGRSWKGYRRGNFSYDQRKASSIVPAVWIVRAEDQPRGRQLLRDMGLLESTREELPSFLPASRHGGACARASSARAAAPLDGHAGPARGQRKTRSPEGGTRPAARTPRNRRLRPGAATRRVLQRI